MVPQCITNVCSAADVIWVEDSLPSGAGSESEEGEVWNWVSAEPAPFSGALACKSEIRGGLHQYVFMNATDTLAINAGDTLIAYAYLDPANPPSTVMLQWYDGTWQHRAYWGINTITEGENGTDSRRPMGALPPLGVWVRLVVPASEIGLEGSILSGMAFTLYDGCATWDSAGKLVRENAPVLDPIADIIVAEGEAVVLNSPATDQDGDMLTFSYAGWMTSDTYTTSYFDAGVHTVTVTVSDGILTDTQDVTVTVTDVDVDPVGDIIIDTTVDTAVGAGGGASSAWILEDSDDDIIIDIDDVVVNDEDPETYIDYEDSEAYAATMSNDAPVLSTIADISVNEGEIVSFSPTATDAEGDTLTYSYTGWMTSSSYTTDYTDSGTHTVTVTVTDEGGLTDSQDVTVTVTVTDEGGLTDSQDVIVNNVNQAPVLDEISDITVNEGETVSFSPTATDSDGGTLTFSYTGWMTSSSYTTNYTDAGIHTVTVTVSDGNVADDVSQDVTVTVNDDPTFFSDLDSYLGLASNWEPLTPSRWDVISDGGDLRYGINTSNYSHLSGYRLGEYSLISNRPYGDFVFTGKVRTTENLATDIADFDIVFGFQDPNNYYYMMFNSNSSWSDLHKVVNGTRTTIAGSTGLSISDNNYHDVKLERAGSSIKVYYDGVLKVNTTDSTFLTGQVGIGSFDDAPLWDDITLSGNSVPVITITGDNPLEVLLNSTYTDAGATASDLDDGDLTASISTVPTVDMSTVGTYTVTYTVNDSDSITVQAVRTVNIGVPTITINGINPLNVILNSTYIDAEATASDPEDGDLTASISTVSTVDTSTVGTYTVAYTVTDSVGNTVQAVRTVTVNINQSPVLTVSGNMFINEGATATITASATDPEGNNLTYSFSGWMNSTGQISTGQNFTDSRVASYTDSGGPYSVTVTVSDGNVADDVSQTVYVTVLNTAILSWTAPSDEDPGDGTYVSGVKGYKVYYGSSGGPYTLATNGTVVNDSSAGSVISVELSSLGIPGGKSHSIVVTAYDVSNNESDPSNEVTDYYVP